MNRLVRVAVRACLPCLLLLPGPARAAESSPPLPAPSAASTAARPALSASQAQAGFQARQAERLRLERQRSLLGQQYAAERARCMRRFQVFACLDQAAAGHRRLDRVLAERLRELDLLDREQRAEQERERVRAHLAARAQDEARRAARQRAQAPAPRPPTQPASSAARPNPRPTPRPNPRPTPPAPRKPLQSASQALSARRESLQREQAYDRLRMRARAQQGSHAPALPVPPASGPLRLPR